MNNKEKNTMNNKEKTTTNVNHEFDDFWKGFATYLKESRKEEADNNKAMLILGTTQIAQHMFLLYASFMKAGFSEPAALKLTEDAFKIQWAGIISSALKSED